jgi:multicomponent Na+:H+ antiporter subunit C
MIWMLALALWLCLAAGLYLALSRDLLRIVVGLALLGSGVNLLLLAAGRMGSAQPAIVAAGQQALGEAANAVPQALILTAIVIGFALTCFSFVLVMRLLQRTDNDDASALRAAEPEPTDAVKPPLPRDEADPGGPSAGPLPSRPAIPSGDRPRYSAGEGLT